jgi:predicted P-loop ATPase
MNWLKKLIPSYLEIRSLYWVEHGKQMDIKLGNIFDAIDEDNYVKAKELINEFESEFSQGGVPNWIAIKYAEIYRAKSMVAFLLY